MYKPQLLSTGPGAKGGGSPKNAGRLFQHGMTIGKGKPPALGLQFPTHITEVAALKGILKNGPRREDPGSGISHLPSKRNEGFKLFKLAKQEFQTTN